jgi:transcriptional regulator with XRE-family HTH domain
MQDFPKLAAQVRGARALLGWTQAYLAEGINVRRAIIADFESCKHEPKPSTVFALINELVAAGIVFTETGVEFRIWPPRPYVPSGCAATRKRARRKYCPRGRVTALECNWKTAYLPNSPRGSGSSRS